MLTLKEINNRISSCKNWIYGLSQYGVKNEQNTIKINKYKYQLEKLELKKLEIKESMKDPKEVIKKQSAMLEVFKTYMFVTNDDGYKLNLFDHNFVITKYQYDSFKELLDEKDNK